MDVYVSPSTLFFFYKIYLRLYGVFAAAPGLSLVVERQVTVQLWCAGFSLQWLLLCEACVLECWLSRSTRGMWDLPGAGIEPISPALADRFSTTGPPGKPSPSSLDSSFGFIHTSIVPKLNKYGGQHTALMHSVPSFKPVHCSCPVLTLLLGLPAGFSGGR